MIHAPDELVFTKLEDSFRSHRNSIFTWVSVAASIDKATELNCHLSGRFSIVLEALDHLLMFVALFPHIEYGAEDLSTVCELLVNTTIKFIHSIPDSLIGGSKLVETIDAFQQTTIPSHTSPTICA